MKSAAFQLRKAEDRLSLALPIIDLFSNHSSSLLDYHRNRNLVDR